MKTAVGILCGFSACCLFVASVCNMGWAIAAGPGLAAFHPAFTAALCLMWTVITTGVCLDILSK